jgi:thiol-disulfide isomerase/thioredoxin
MVKTKIILALLIIALLILTGCQKEGIVYINNNGAFTELQCSKRGFQDKVIMLESKFCHACKLTKPIFIEACEERNIEPIILDLAEEEQRAQMNSYMIDIQYTPTFIIGCNYYIGGGEKEEFLNLLDKLLAKQ